MITTSGLWMSEADGLKDGEIHPAVVIKALECDWAPA
jgi:hypothetical protein